MKPKTFILALCTCLASAIPAVAGPYVGFGAGLSINHDSDIDPGSGDIEYDPGYGLNVAAGYDFNPVRLEAEFAYRNAEIDNASDADFTTMSYMINGYYDMKNINFPFKPYLGVGLGVINGELDNGIDDDDTEFGYQLTAGVSNKIAQNVNLDIYYRYQGTASDFDMGGSELSYDNSSFFVGFRFAF
ncbi:outer membrane protein [Geobacter sp.]|uniref:outer membrane protein n=1 Tax=Geobacter sp. TaxID=46610 RepID=UPI0027B994F9|nr:porin family protein [Geobacter sp.]